MQQPDFKVYGYRWIILSIFMLITAANQLLWITFAPVTTEAIKYYGVSDIWIGMLSMSFMLVYLIVSVPASWIIDQYGIRIGLGIGAFMTGLFGLFRGFVHQDYHLLLLMQIGIAIGQPFLINAITKMAARWFPIKERATASGLATLSMYIGILVAMVVTPYLTAKYGINEMLIIYGALSAISAVILIVFLKESPPTAPCLPEQQERSAVLDGFRHTMNSRDFILLMFIFFIGMGVFNGVTTWIDDILGPQGYSPVQAGITGGLMIGGGVAGALILPILSDHFRKRVPFITISLAGATLSLAGITFASSYPLLLVSGTALGFFLLSSGPIGFQYGAEITYPASESASNGLLVLMGQISGIALIFGMSSFKSPINGSMTKPLILLIGCMLFCLLLSFRLKESSLITSNQTKDFIKH